MIFTVAALCLLAVAAADVSHLHNMYLPPALLKSGQVAEVGGRVVTTIERHELQELPEQIEYESNFNAPALATPSQINELMPPMPAEEMLPPPPSTPPASAPAAAAPSSTAPAPSPAVQVSQGTPINEYLAPPATTSMAPESEYLPPTTVATAPQTEYVAPTMVAMDAVANEYLAPETTPVEEAMALTEQQYIAPAEEITPPAIMVIAPPQPNYQQYQEELMLKQAQEQQEQGQEQQQQQQQTDTPIEAMEMEMVMSHELEMPVVPSDAETEAELEPKPAHMLKADGYHYQNGQQQLVF